MKKRIFVMFLAVLMGSQPVLPVLAESMEEVTEESSSLAPERVEEENETERERTEEEKLIEKKFKKNSSEKKLRYKNGFRICKKQCRRRRTGNHADTGSKRSGRWI